MSKSTNFKIFVFFVPLFVFFGIVSAQNKSEKNQKARVVTIPISIFGTKEKRDQQTEEFIEAGTIVVKENGAEQQILSIRSIINTPLSLAILIQDDLTSNANLQLESLKEFIKRLPKGSRVMVGYLRGGTFQIRQKFTEDLEKAAKSIRIISGSGASSGNPYPAVEAALGKFDAMPNGRRAVLLISDGLDATNGLQNSLPSDSIELERTILKAQRKGVAVYSFYNAATLTEGGNSILISNGQGSLEKLSDETGGRAFFQGSISPISFEPFFGELSKSLNRQFALTYLSTNMKKGYYKIQVLSTNPEIRIEHPKGYYYR